MVSNRPALILLLAIACAPEPGVGEIGSRRFDLTQVSNFGSNPGGLKMYLYAPSGMPAGPAAVVVAMHGCTQTAADYVDAGWNTLADQLKFYVVYPQKDLNLRCFDWFEAANTTRGQGEALSIAQMVDYLKGHYSIDSARVFATGLSSGGAMTAVMLAAYPDVFAAGAPIAGIPYGCDSACMYGSEGKTAQQLGDAVRGGFSGFAGPYPRVSIWQGDADEVVDFANFGELVEQWTNVQAIDAVADATEQVGPATHRSYQDGSGNTLVESWQIAQGHHGTPVDPSNGCGKAGSYILDEKLCSSEQIAHFFGIDSPPAIADAGPGPGPDAAVLPGPDASPLPGEDAALSSDVAHADAGTFQDASAAGRDAFWGGGGSGCGCQGAGGADLAVAALLGAALLRALGRGSAKVASRPF